MPALTLQNSNHKILVVGPLYDQIKKLEVIENIADKYDIIIFNGNLCYPNNNLLEIEDRIEKIDKYLKTGKFIYNLGNYDLLLLKQLEIENKQEKIENWLKNKPNVVIINFESQSSLIVTCGGILPKMTKADLYNNLETSFISKVNDKIWHYLYGGSYGYIISNNPLTDNYPSFYNYSAQIGNKYSENVKVYAQEVDQYGLKKTILL